MGLLDQIWSEGATEEIIYLNYHKVYGLGNSKDVQYMRSYTTILKSFTFSGQQHAVPLSKDAIDIKDIEQINTKKHFNFLNHCI